MIDVAMLIASGAECFIALDTLRRSGLEREHNYRLVD